MEKVNLVILGFGSVGSTALKITCDYLGDNIGKITVIADGIGPDRRINDARVSYLEKQLTPENISETFRDHAKSGDTVINLTVDVDTYEIILECLKHGVNYLDTSNEKWTWDAGHNTTSKRRQDLLAKSAALPNAATALICHGANPGLVTHFTKQAIESLALREQSQTALDAIRRHDWSGAARELAIEVIHISERDTQYGRNPRLANEIQNTWSVEGLIAEAFEPVQIALGSHENDDHRFSVEMQDDVQVAIMDQPSKDVHVLSWLPSCGPFLGMAIPHPESFSIASLLATGVGSERYQPTVLFVYQPCDQAIASLQCVANKVSATKQHVMMEDVVGGSDELGVTLLRRNKNEVFWYGSNLTNEEAKQHCGFCNATSLQVAAGVLSGLLWILENPKRGVVEPEFVDHRKVLEIAAPYLGELGSVSDVWEHNQEIDWHLESLII